MVNLSSSTADILNLFVGFVTGDGPVSGQWPVFLDWATDDEHGYTEEDLEQAIKELRQSTGRS